MSVQSVDSRLNQLSIPGAGGPGGAGPQLPGSPITQAAQIQSDAINQAIPFFQPFQQAGEQGLDRLQGASTPQGLDQLLQAIFGGEAFQGLVGERRRGVEGQLAAGGLTRSGAGIEEAANVPTELGLMLEQLLTGRNTNLASGGLNASISIGDLLSRSAEATASGILGLEEQRIGQANNSSDNTTSLIGSIIGAFSDPRLKENIRTLGQIGPLRMVEWDWKPELKDTIVWGYPTVGFLSTDVKEIYPDLVGEFGGFDIINSSELFERLSCH